MPMIRTFNVSCPDCKSILVINRDTGAVLEVRKPLVDDPTDNRLNDALRAHEKHSAKLQGLFSASLADVSKREQERKELFEQSLQKARESDESEEMPLRDIDLD
ncbi:MAG: hypothetical protein NTV22_09955 [bacterium]|nr:hypothetical protein [bacterium]